jgi:predicted XRE-type DNA-binding protein
LSLSIDFEPLNRTSRARAQHVIVGTIIIDHVVLNADVGHVHRVVDVVDVLRPRVNAIAQDRLTDKASIDKIVIGRTDIEFDVHLTANGLPLINNSGAAGRQRRPPDIVAAGPPRDPGWTPIEIGAGEPDPAGIN